MGSLAGLSVGLVRWVGLSVRPVGLWVGTSKVLRWGHWSLIGSSMGASKGQRGVVSGVVHEVVGVIDGGVER